MDNYITDGFVKEGSLKAHKAELDRAAKELEDEERAKAEKADKRARSGKKVSCSTGHHPFTGYLWMFLLSI